MYKSMCFLIKVRSILLCLETHAGAIHFIFAVPACQHGGVNRMGHMTSGAV